MYPFNWPFAKTISSLGLPLLIKIQVFYDDEAEVYIATSPMVKGLIIEADSLDEIRKEVELTLPELLELNNNLTKSEINHQHARLQFNTPLHA